MSPPRSMKPYVPPVIIDGEVQRDRPPAELPPWHPLLVPGQNWMNYYRSQRAASNAKSRAAIDAELCPDPRRVEPPKYDD